MDNPNNPVLPGVSCSVSDCQYHDNANKCHAASIKVGGINGAYTPEDTECDTFCKR